MNVVCQYLQLGEAVAVDWPYGSEQMLSGWLNRVSCKCISRCRNFCLSNKDGLQRALSGSKRRRMRNWKGGGRHVQVETDQWPECLAFSSHLVASSLR